MFKKLYRWIKRKLTPASKPIGNYGSHGEGGEAFKPKWGIIVPHTLRAGGARTPDKKWNEYFYAQEMLKFLKKQRLIPSATRDNGGVSQAARDLVRAGATATLEPHKDAYNSRVGGYSILVLKGDNLSKELALKIISLFEQKYPSRSKRSGDGVKEVEGRDNGAANLRAAKRAGAEAALLSELFFIDNRNEFIEPEEMALFWVEALQ